MPGMATPGIRHLLPLLQVAAAALLAGAAPQPPPHPLLPRGAPTAAAESCERLPMHAQPHSQLVIITPDFETDTFKGRTFIAVRTNLSGLSQDIDYFVMHAQDLDITSCMILVLAKDLPLEDTLDNYASTRFGCQDLVHDSVAQTVTIYAYGAHKIYGDYRLILEFTGKIRDDMTGFYKTTYVDDEGMNRSVLATQFQPTHARKVFPCFDEPRFKIPYHIEINIPDGYPEFHVLSNMPLPEDQSEDSDEDDGSRKFVFPPTPPMSSYLVAWVVSDFVPRSDSSSNESDVRVTTWARPNVIQWADYSLEVTRPLLEALEDFTSIPYLHMQQHSPQFDKVDQVAIPDFAAGAMENWGLVTYRETALLYNEGAASARRRVLSIIAHELVHMWFGNLVTTAQWDTAWLNEGFAEYLEYLMADRVEEGWQLEERFVVEELHPALLLDAQAAAPALSRPACTPEEALAAFHYLIYSKGSSVLRMFRYIIGEDNFREALRSYLKNNAFKAVQPDDLFTELNEYSEEAGLSRSQMDQLLRSWTEQNGYPFLVVIRDYQARTAIVTQRRYQLPVTNAKYPLHYVPLTWTQRGHGFHTRRPQKYMSTEDSRVIVDGMPDNSTWVIFNVQQTGYYRVNYDTDNWALIAEYLNSEANPLDGIHVLNRAQLLDDAFNFGRSGHLQYKIIFRLAEYLQRETEYVPWVAAFTGLSYLDRMFVYHEQYPLFKEYVLNIILNLYERFQFQDQDSHIDKMLLNRVSTLACSLDHSHCTEAAVNALHTHVDEGVIVPADLRSVVYCHGIRNTEDIYWTSLWNKYTETKDETEKTLILAGLGCSKNEEILTQFLHKSITGEDIRKQDAASVFSAVYSNPQGVEVALDFLAANFIEISNYYGSMGAIDNIVIGIAGRLTTEGQFSKLDAFLIKYEKELGNTADTARSTATSNLQWLSLLVTEVIQALEQISLYRLPTSVMPQQYYLTLQPDLDTDTFQGHVSISVSIKESTNNIYIHTQDLDIQQSNVKVYRSGGGDVRNVAIRTHVNYSRPDDSQHRTEDNLLQDLKKLTDFHLIKLELREKLMPGAEYVIDITYSGQLRDDMVGFYKTFYLDDTGEQKKLVATKFAPVHARKAFPCFDEPSFKARFKITIVIPETLANYDCLANADKEQTTQQDDGSTKVEFQNSPKMSTYIVAWIVSDLASASDPEPGPVRFTTWARKNAIAWADYSLQVSAKMLNVLEEYTDFPYLDENDEYPLKKMDQVGTPDFVSGAMENWGLITYRETTLLYNDGSADAKKRVATVIAHELAHMWFGNIVTCEWWSATWLNEGFATYFEFLGTDPIQRNWYLMDQFVVDEMLSALALDSDPSSKPLTRRVRTPADAIASFGSLTYSKGASFLRMLSYVIGAHNLKSAIQSYVKKMQYAAATPADLFVELARFADAAGLDAEQMMEFLESWTEQPGYPLLYVTRRYDGSGVVTVTQKRFLEPYNDVNPQLYYVPLSWVEDGGMFDTPVLKGFLSNKEPSKELSGFNEDGWLIFNTQHMGYFRVMYDDQNFQRLTEQLNSIGFENIHWLNRAQLLDDAFVLARARYIAFQQLLDLTDYLLRENDYTPWAAALTGFAELDRLLAAHPGHYLFKEYVLSRVSNVYSYMGFAARDSQPEKLLVAAVTARACAMGHEGCQLRAANLLRQDLDGGARVAADVRGAVYCHGVRNLPDNYWDALWIRFAESHDEAERALLLAGLGCSASADRLRLYLENTVNGRGVRKQEGTTAFAAVYATQLGANVTLQFLHDNYEQTNRALGSVNSIVSGLANRLVLSYQRESLQQLVAARWWDGLGSSGSGALRAVDRNLEWVQGNAFELLRIIDEKLATTPRPSTTTDRDETTTISPTPTSTPSISTPPTSTPSTSTPTSTPSTSKPTTITTEPTNPTTTTDCDETTFTTVEPPTPTTDSGSSLNAAYFLMLLSLGVWLTWR